MNKSANEVTSKNTSDSGINPGQMVEKVDSPQDQLDGLTIRLGKGLKRIPRNILLPMLGPLLAIILALIIGAVFILFAGVNPFEAYGALFKGALIGEASLLRTLRWMTPLVISGLAASVAFRGGMFNVGVEGSLWVGGLASAIVGIYVTGLPAYIHIPLALAAGAVVGGLWCLVPGIARAKYKVDEVVFTLMLNYIAILSVQYLVRYYLLDSTRLSLSFADPETRFILPTAELPWINQTYQLSTGLFLSLGLVVLFYFIFKNSKWGYENRMTGLNALFARFGGVPILPIAVSAMVLSGALGGVTGAVELLGNYHRFFGKFSVGLGFDGVTIALMGNLNPFGVLISSFFLAALKNGGSAMERGVNVSRDIVKIIQALVLLFVTAQRLFEYLKLKKRERVEE
jgi:general nucleoside transport system permease protein